MRHMTWPMIAALAITVAACGKTHFAGGTAPSGAASSAVSALATSTAGQDAQALVKKCIPGNALAQIQLGHRLLTDTSKHPNGSWAQLLRCTGVTPDNKQAIESAALAAAEKVNWTSRTDRKQYFEVTLPNVITSFASIPGVSVSPTTAASQ